MQKIKKTISILLSVLMVLSVFAVVPFTASAAEETTISNVDEWNTFVSSVNSGNTYEGKTVKLTADIENITNKINIGKEFNGTFDGQNHTLMVNLQYGTDARGAGLFPRVGNDKSITVKNLTLGGVIVGGMHTGGIVGEAADSSRNNGGATITIENVNVVAYITQPETHLGGFIGHTNTRSTVTINNCHFLGDLRKSSGEAAAIGGIVGWRSGNTPVSISDSGFGGTVGDTQDFNAWVMLFEDPEHTHLTTGGTLYTCEEAHYNLSDNRIGQYSPTHIACKQIAHAVTKSEYSYDGNPHGLEISTTAPTSGAIITYGTEEGKYLYANSPTLTEAGSKTVYYQIAYPGYATVRGSAVLTVKPSYTVTWKNDDGTDIDTTTVAEGETPTHADPTKADDDNAYTFTGWTPALAPVTADATYTATYTATPYVASVTSNGTTTKYTDFGTAVSNWTDGSTLTLLADVTTSSTIGVSGPKTLDLNGKTITMTGNDCILYVNGGSLTVNGNGGTLTGGKGGRNYGDSYRRGGAIDLKSGSVVLDNCNITNNTSSFGSAVFMAGSTVLTIQNGTAITNNVGGSAVLWVQGGTVNMTGGTISNNSATAVSMQSNNWYSDLSRFNMSGGTISNNTGSGVGFAGNQTGQCSVSGNAVIKDNTSANLNLSGSVLLNVNGELGDDASIGITKNPGVFTNSTDTSFNDASKFFSDNSNYGVFKNAAGQLELKEACTVTWKNGDTVLKTEKVAKGTTPQYTGETPTKVDDDNIYTFSGWNPAPAPVAADTTYTAQFTATYVASVTTADGATTKYTDFIAARDAWTEGTTLTLLSDIEMTTGQSQGGAFIAGLQVTNAKTLDLNGKTLSLASSVSFNQERVIDVTGGGNLTIKDSSGTNAGKITGASPFGDNGWSAGLYINQNGTATMYGGTITGNTTTNGAGVWIDGRHTKAEYRDATFNMYGGVITGNTAATGGGVYVGCVLNNHNTATTGHFNMFGGTITGNTATNGSNVYVNDDHGVMTHTGGTIDGGYVDNRYLYVTVSFNANGGTGTMSDQYVKKSTDTQIKANENYDNNGAKTEPAFTREGYTFIGWNTEQDGSGIDFIAGVDNINITENTTLYAKWKPNLFVGHSISLNGDVTLNFFINPHAIGRDDFNNYNNAKVTFTWDEGNGEKYGTASVNLKDAVLDSTTGYYKVSCNVAAAHMGHKVLAKLYLDSEEPVETDAYSVREYAEIIWNNPSQYDTKNKPNELKTLVQAMLNYGAMSQLVFEDDLADKTVELVNKVVGDNGYKDVTSAEIAAAIHGSASNMNTVATQLGAKYYTTSLLYLSENKLRVYFTPTTYPGQIPNSGGFTGNKAGYYYYMESAPIAAADLDEQQTLSVNGVDIKVSALDYAKVIVENKNNQMNETQINLAKALFLYNQAANAYFV